MVGWLRSSFRSYVPACLVASLHGCLVCLSCLFVGCQHPFLACPNLCLPVFLHANVFACVLHVFWPARLPASLPVSFLACSFPSSLFGLPSSLFRCLGACMCVGCRVGRVRFRMVVWLFPLRLPTCLSIICVSVCCCLCLLFVFVLFLFCFCLCLFCCYV